MRLKQQLAPRHWVWSPVPGLLFGETNEPASPFSCLSAVVMMKSIGGVACVSQSGTAGRATFAVDCATPSLPFGSSDIESFGIGTHKSGLEVLCSQGQGPRTACTLWRGETSRHCIGTIQVEV